MQAIPSPSSSTTTPSPSMSFRQPSEVPDSIHLTDIDPQEREERQRAVKKLLARTEFSKLTRGLRARLAYASFKATHNLSHATLPDLEERILESTPSPAPSPPPAAPVPPQSPFSSPHKRRPTMPPPASPSRSLYSSLLGQPPAKRPRHAYGSGSNGGPGPSPSELLPSYAPATPRSRVSASPRRTPHAHSPFHNNGQGRTVRTVMEGRARSAVTEKADINAAATLTALMFNRGSPKTTRPEAGTRRTATPVPPQEAKHTEDADAAELMLYLATSPSPVRPPVQRRPGPTSMGRVLFPGGASSAEKDDAPDRPGTPALTHSQSQPSSQETIVSQLLPPPPSPSRSQARSPKSASANAKRSPMLVPRKSFADSEEARRISELRDPGGRSPRFSLAKARWT